MNYDYGILSDDGIGTRFAPPQLGVNKKGGHAAPKNDVTANWRMRLLADCAIDAIPAVRILVATTPVAAAGIGVRAV